jgi:hypothetical protein
MCEGGLGRHVRVVRVGDPTANGPGIEKQCLVWNDRPGESCFFDLFSYQAVSRSFNEQRT